MRPGDEIALGNYRSIHHQVFQGSRIRVSITCTFCDDCTSRMWKFIVNENLENGTKLDGSCFRNDSLMVLPVIFRTFSWCIFIQGNERGKFKIVWWIGINLSENYTVNDISSSL